MSLFTETVTLHVPGEPTGEKDALGRPIIGPDQTIENQPAWYEERTSSESTDARDQRVWGYWLYLPLDAPFTDKTEVTLPVDDVRYWVVGEPGRQPGGFIVEGYIRAAIEKRTG